MWARGVVAASAADPSDYRRDRSRYEAPPDADSGRRTYSRMPSLDAAFTNGSSAASR
jgi:hypothetical protein